MKSGTTSQIYEQVRVKAFLEREIVLVRFETLIDLSSLVDLHVDWTDQLEEAVVSCAIDVVYCFDDEAKCGATLEDLILEYLCDEAQKSVVIPTS